MASRTPYFFFVYRDRANEYRWRFYAPNTPPKILADSGEGYKNKADCIAGMNLVAGNSAGASIVYDASAQAA